MLRRRAYLKVQKMKGDFEGVSKPWGQAFTRVELVLMQEEGVFGCGILRKSELEEEGI